MARYKILRTAPTFLLGRSGNPIAGKSVTVLLLDYDEEHTIEVEKLDPDLIETEIEALIDMRNKLDQLGE